MLGYHNLPPHKRAPGAKAKPHVKGKSKKPPGKSSQQPSSKAPIPPQVHVRHNTGPSPGSCPYTQLAPYSHLAPHVPFPNHYHIPPQTSPYGYQHTPLLTNERPWMNTLQVGLQNSNDLTEVIRRPIEATLTGLEQWHQRGSNSYHQGVGHGSDVCNLISSKFNAVLTSIDGEAFSGDERELVIYPAPDPAIRGGWGVSSREVSKKANNAIPSATGPKGTNYFNKVNSYANSKLPPDTPHLRLYLLSYQLICLAAQYSLRVYTKPVGKEREAHIEADWRLGTKAMVIKSVPNDDRNAVVFAIRGSQTFMDWAVNLNSTPSSPENFLDDSGNLCHSGFLAVARKMIKPVATRLRSLLEEDPSRSNCSLIMTGHSAGGAVAILLFAHLMEESVRSELNVLAGCFKRIHCITFGAPPVSLLPIVKSNNPRYRKSLFLSFINEGDPVPRADKAYLRSLLDLYSSPSPASTCVGALLPSITIPKPKIIFNPLRPKPQKSNSAPAAPLPVWHVPPGSLSNAGRLVVLRATGDEDDVTALVTSDQQLRMTVFGNPVMHMMKVYARRVEVLTTKAITANVWG